MIKIILGAALGCIATIAAEALAVWVLILRDRR